MIVGAAFFIGVVIAVAIAIALATPRTCVIAAEPRVWRLESPPPGDAGTGARAARLEAELGELGFEPLGAFAIELAPDVEKRVRSVQTRRVLLSRDRTEQVEVVEIRRVRATPEGERPFRRASVFLSIRSQEPDGRSFVTYGYERDDAIERPARQSWRRLPGVESAREMLDAHRAHLADAGARPLQLAPDRYEERLLRAHREMVEQLQTNGYVRREGARLRATPKLAIRNALLVLWPAGMEERRARGFALLAVIAFLGAAWALAIVRHLPDAADGAAVGLFLAISGLTLLLLRDSRWLSWGWACLPAAIALDARGVTTWVPWAGAFALVGIVGSRASRAVHVSEKTSRSPSSSSR